MPAWLQKQVVVFSISTIPSRNLQIFHRNPRQNARTPEILDFIFANSRTVQPRTYNWRATGQVHQIFHRNPRSNARIPEISIVISVRSSTFLPQIYDWRGTGKSSINHSSYPQGNILLLITFTPSLSSQLLAP